MRRDLVFGGSSELWHALVREAEARAQTALDEELESYLVFVLMRYLRDDSLLARALALDLLEALETVGRRRADELRDVGDRCLLIAGLFPSQAERRRVDRGYFRTLGRNAYHEVAAQARSAYAQLFEHLSEGFNAMVRVLSAVPGGGPGRGDGAPGTGALRAASAGLLH